MHSRILSRSFQAQEKHTRHIFKCNSRNSELIHTTMQALTCTAVIPVITPLRKETESYTPKKEQRNTHKHTLSASLWDSLYLSNTWTLMPCWTPWWGVLQATAQTGLILGHITRYRRIVPLKHPNTHSSRLIDTCMQSSADVIYQSPDGRQTLVSSCQHTLMSSRFTLLAWMYCHKNYNMCVVKQS